MLYPKIGIRPVIDGRWGGVRESLENQTMRMGQLRHTGSAGCGLCCVQAVRTAVSVSYLS